MKSLRRTWHRVSNSAAWRIAEAATRSGERVANSRLCRFTVRTSAVALLAFTTGYGLLAGDYLADPSSGTRGLPAQLSSYFGYAAEEIRINGLKRVDGAVVMNAIGVKPGGSLIGFDANTARRILLNLDWVKTASVRMLPPNRLEIDVTEREPFAIWQREGNYYVIDREGSAMASFQANKFLNLMLVSGEGAQESVSQLVNQLEVWPELHSMIKGAARVGKRRWTLYFDGGRQALLPENGVDKALAILADLEARNHVLASGIQQIDLRLAGSVVLVPFENLNEDEARKVASRTR